MSAPRPDEVPALLQGLLDGRVRPLARLITLVEDDPERALALVAHLPPRPTRPPRGHVLGVTGPPGAGKSTLVDRLISRERAADHRVAVLLVDPSSPFSAGAVLGDRIRMQHHTADPGVFIRSLGSRGHGGGLSAGTPEVVALCLAAGYDRVLLETVGVGQTELEVMGLADTVVVVAVPGTGDSIQAMKAGLLEIGHVFVVNKADRPGADLLLADLREMVRDGVAPERIRRGGWEVCVLQTSALEGTGLDELARALDAHRSVCDATYVPPTDPVAETERLVLRALARRASHALHRSLGVEGTHASMGRALRNGGTTPYAAALQLLADPDLPGGLLGTDSQ